MGRAESGRRPAVPGAVHADERAVGEGQAERRDVRFQRIVGRNRGGDQVRARRLRALVDVLAVRANSVAAPVAGSISRISARPLSASMPFSAMLLLEPTVT
jgi:hypothetical protein